MSARDRLESVRGLNCVVCAIMGMRQETPTEAHHLESVRDGLSDWATVAVCRDHHSGKNGIHGLSRSGFEARYKLTPIDLLALTIRAMEKYHG